MLKQHKKNLVELIMFKVIYFYEDILFLFKANIFSWVVLVGKPTVIFGIYEAIARCVQYCICANCSRYCKSAGLIVILTPAGDTKGIIACYFNGEINRKYYRLFFPHWNSIAS